MIVKWLDGAEYVWSWLVVDYEEEEKCASGTVV